MRFIAMLAVLVAGSAQCEELSAERELPVHDGRDAYTPAAAFVEDGYLVVWQSGRLAPGDLREGFKFSGDIVGCRVDKSGRALDAQPFVICKADDLQERPQVAAGRDMALVVWHDLRGGKDWDVYAARVSPEGKVLDPDGFLISGGARSQANPRVAWDGKTFVVVWQDLRGGERYEVFAARVSSDGRVLDPDGIRISSASGKATSWDPVIASSGDGRSFILWNQGTAEALFLTDGKPGAPTYKAPATATGSSADGLGNRESPFFAAAGKGAFLVAWRTYTQVSRAAGPNDVNAAIFDAEGKKVTQRKKKSEGGSLTLGGREQWILNADLSWDGKAFAAAWTEYCSGSREEIAHEQVFVSRIATDGNHIGPAQHVAGSLDSPAMNPAVASGGAGTTILAYEKHPEKGDVPIKIGFRMLRAGP